MFLLIFRHLQIMSTHGGWSLSGQNGLAVLHTEPTVSLGEINTSDV